MISEIVEATRFLAYLIRGEMRGYGGARRFSKLGERCDVPHLLIRTWVPPEPCKAKKDRSSKNLVQMRFAPNTFQQ